MLELRIQGRGGQGSVTAANILAQAAYYSNLSARSFPMYGAERRGAPVVAFLRVDQKPILSRSMIDNPDCVMVIDPKLMKTVPILNGLKQNGMLILNTSKSIEEIQTELKGNYSKIAVLDATRLAQEVLGRPITNTVMLGAFSRAYPEISLENLSKAIRDMFGPKGSELNIRAAELAYEQTVVREVSAS
ncbi:MAG: 2-oxoacid:acceptor oxidoreductase family protein [Thermincola sp.]|jgi:2-oxoacid:acceptor oxidoreductase gamma subunit (pyruvate/2-ketoisovalerate family)|nr:2-oxoacid:acceptor oxidoreductase family protein [Thermincola sp.]MDT3704926.1 2-oxoacid:acceptor oxidoreductase family protein [Thermincola sp.]